MPSLFRRRRRTDTETRVITTRFPGVCAESGQPVAAGESVLFVGASRSIYRLDTATADAWFDAQPTADDRHDHEYEDACRDACGL